MKRPGSVDEYIHAAPVDAQPLLNQLRKIIRMAAPQAQEKISYGMPFYSYCGRLAYFAYAKNHVGLYALLGAFAAHKSEVKKYRTSKATLQFSLGEKLPVSLVKKLVKTQMKINEQKMLKKK